MVQRHYKLGGLILSLLWSLLFSHLAAAAVGALQRDDEGTDYGLDVSFPVQGRVSVNYPKPELNDSPKVEFMPLQPLGNRQQLYLDYLEGCRNRYGPNDSFRCDTFEYERMLMNRRQPQSMVNLTETGWRKVRAPAHLKELVDDFWNKNQEQEKEEFWHVGNSYVNHWDAPTGMVSVDDKGLRGSGARLKQHIWAAVSAVLEEWTHQELQPCSLYGIRVYHEGAIMMPHVDRLPLVASAIINVAQDADEPWPTEVYDHTGMAHNVTLEPGDMLLFESGSVIHGHPFPLKGRFYASIFIHFEPTGHALGKNESGFFYAKDDTKRSMRTSSSNSRKGASTLDSDYRKEANSRHGGQSSAWDGKLPPYIQRESPEEEHWLSMHPSGWEPPAAILPPEAHVAAKKGLLDELEQELKDNGSAVLTERDENGWQVLHQGVAGGSSAVVEFLVAHGADINARTHGGYGETPLRIAEKTHGSKNHIVEYLKSMGGLSIGPEL